MNLKRVEQLLRRYARLRPPERLLSEEKAAELRARLAPSASEGETDVGDPAEVVGAGAPAARASPRKRYRLAWAGLAAVAAMILVAVLTTSRRGPLPAPGLLVDGAYDKAALFRTTRGESTPAGDRGNLFYIGVKVDRPAFIRIIVLDDGGKLEVLPLDRSGAVERRVTRDTETVFGGYELRSVDESGFESRVEALIILACAKSLSRSGVSAWVEDRNDAGRDHPGMTGSELLSELKSRFNCAAEMLSL